MIHYHGGPITPETCALRAWAGRHAFVSWTHQQQMTLAVSITQSFALDNGAFPLWKSGKAVNWNEFYAWIEKWRHHPRFDFAIVPDVIEGSEEENDALAEQWPFPRHQAAVVWHTNESPERLERLARTWPRVAIGSSGQFDVSRPKELLARMADVLPRILTPTGHPICKLHGLRMLNPKVFESLPLASADSTNVARNIGIDKAWKGTYLPATKESRTQVLVERIERTNSACHFVPDNEAPPHCSDLF